MARRLLPLSLWIGAVYDAGFGALILVAPGFGGTMLGVVPPDDTLYLRFIGVFLVALALAYSLPARDPDRYRGVAVVAVAARLMGCAYLAGANLFFSRPGAFLVLGGLDGAFALLHALGLRLRPAPRNLPL